MSGSSSSFSGAGNFAMQQMTSFPPPAQGVQQGQQPQQHNLSKPALPQGTSANIGSSSSFNGTVNGAISGLSFPSMDLSGKLIIKVRIEGDDDVRRIPIHNEDITYNELLLMMQRVFLGKISSSDDVVVKYRDDDGDFITIADNSDLTVAKQTSRILHLKLFVQGRVFRQISGCSCDVHDVREQLIKVRNHVNYLLDLIVPDGAQKQQAAAEAEEETAVAGGAGCDGDVDQHVATTLFDPLKYKNKPAQAPFDQLNTQGPPPPSAATPAQAQPAVMAPAAAPEVAGSASAIADSFGLSPDEMAPPPEQPNAPPSDAMNSPGYPPSQPQQPAQQSAPPQSQNNQAPMGQQNQMAPSTGYASSSTSSMGYSPGGSHGTGSAPSAPPSSYPPAGAYPASTGGNSAAPSGSYPQQGQAPPPSSMAQAQPSAQPPTQHAGQAYGSYPAQPASYSYPPQAGSAPGQPQPQQPQQPQQPSNQYQAPFAPRPGAPPAAGASNPYARQPAGNSGYGGYYMQPGYNG